jgi:hypothetical protein
MQRKEKGIRNGSIERNVYSGNTKKMDQKSSKEKEEERSIARALAWVLQDPILVNRCGPSPWFFGRGNETDHWLEVVS